MAVTRQGGDGQSQLHVDLVQKKPNHAHNQDQTDQLERLGIERKPNISGGEKEENDIIILNAWGSRENSLKRRWSSNLKSNWADSCTSQDWTVPDKNLQQTRRQLPLVEQESPIFEYAVLLRSDWNWPL